jgi:hypothetical protein
MRGTGAAAALLLAIAASPAAPASDTDAELAGLLPRLARVALLYRDTALRFACEETIQWEGPRLSTRREKFSYVYTWDDQGGFRNFRTWTGWTPNAGYRQVHPKAPTYLQDVLLWAFVFRDTRQPLHRFRSAGRETVHARAAVRVEFAPIPPIESGVNDWYGTAWIDAETAQLLRVEAREPQDHERLAELERRLADAASVGYSQVVRRFVTDYTVVEQGLRLPGRVEIRESRFEVQGRPGALRLREHPLLQVTQTYEDHRFFSVRTAEEIRGMVDDPEEAR